MRGIKEKARRDDALLAAALRIFDHFDAAYAQGRRAERREKGMKGREVV